MKLTHLKPCSYAAEWLLSQPDHQTAWNACERADWMIWYLGKIGCSQQMLVTISCRIARTVAHLAPPPEALAAIEAAERWVLDQSEENRRAAADAADAADAAYDAAAAYAACAADAAAAYAAARAAYAAADAACAADAAKREHCNIIRELIPECPK